MYKRIIGFDRPEGQSWFLFGPRQTGKSTLLAELFPRSRIYDLLLSDVYGRLVRRPWLLREELASPPDGPVIIDEIQKIPALLDEVHWLIERKGVRFILSGSSARKLRRGHANLLAGRALHQELFPLVSAEIPGFDLLRALNHGLLPRMYLAEDASPFWEAYVGDYLKEEIAAEALVRNLSAFGRFLEAAALSNGQTVNFEAVARDCGVSSVTVRDYFGILEDTLVASFLPAYRRRPKRRTIHAPKFYLFDVGLAAHLARKGRVEAGSELFGRAFEHWLFMELRAWRRYRGGMPPLAYWRTASGFEVDFVLGDHEVAVEAKAVTESHDGHLKGLRAFGEEFVCRRRILVTLEAVARRLSDGIEVLPWREFVAELWTKGL